MELSRLKSENTNIIDTANTNNLHSSDLNQNEKRLKSTIDHLNKELADVKNQSQQLNQDQENLLILLEEMEKKKKIYKHQLKSISSGKNNSNPNTFEISTDEEDENEQNSDSTSNNVSNQTQLTSSNPKEQVQDQKNIALNNEFEISRSHYNDLNFNLKNKSNGHQSFLASDQNDFDLKLNNQYSSFSTSASSSDNISSIDTSITSSSSSSSNPSAHNHVNNIANKTLVSNFTSHFENLDSKQNENFASSNPLQKYFK